MGRSARTITTACYRSNRLNRSPSSSSTRSSATQSKLSRIKVVGCSVCSTNARTSRPRSEEHTSELQSRGHLVCRLLLEKKKKDSENVARRYSQKPGSTTSIPDHTSH